MGEKIQLSFTESFVIAGGCSECLAKIYGELRGVSDAMEPSVGIYKDDQIRGISAVKVFYHTAQINFDKLMEIFFSIYYPINADIKNKPYIFIIPSPSIYINYLPLFSRFKPLTDTVSKLKEIEVQNEERSSRDIYDAAFIKKESNPSMHVYKSSCKEIIAHRLRLLEAKFPDLLR